MCLPRMSCVIDGFTYFQTIQVGSDFQAVIPGGLSVYGDAPAYENEDRLLWDPSKSKDEKGNLSAYSKMRKKKYQNYFGFDLEAQIFF